jgi:hypothetical protein
MDLWTQDARASPPDDRRSCAMENDSIGGLVANVVGNSSSSHVFVRGSDSIGFLRAEVVNGMLLGLTLVRTFDMEIPNEATD